MYNPFNMFQKGLSNNLTERTFKYKNLHPIVRWFELIAFLSIVPAMLTTIHAIGLSVVAVYCVYEIEKGNKIIPAILLAVFNFFPGGIALFAALFNPTAKILTFGVIYFTIGVLGFLPIYTRSGWDLGV